MIELEKHLENLDRSHPTLFALLCFVLVFTVLVALILFLLFSDLDASADFVYNQF